MLLRVYAYFWPFKGAAVSRAQDSRPCTLLSFRTCWRIRIVSTVFCLRCAYIFSNHSGHAWPYVGKVLHNKIDVYVRLPSAKTAQPHPNAYNHADSRAQSAVPVQRICTFLCVAQIIKRKHTAQAHSKRIQPRRLVNENAVSVQIICQFCASCRVVEHKFNPCAQNLEFSCVS